jgi:hypothetical protein
MNKLITILSPLEAEAFETQCYVEAFKRLKTKGFPADQGKFFVLLDNWGLTEENLKPLGLEVAGRNLVRIAGEVVIA